ncbi:MAG: alanine/ornithine racemase family PLP-dependent enzyme [Acidimicrobiia bacterium]
MTAPRLEIRLDRIRHNAAALVARLGQRGIVVTGVTKAVLGSHAIARELLDAGVTSIGDSRIENLEGMVRAGLSCPMTLLRSPMLSEANRVVASADTSLNSELAVLEQLSSCAHSQGRKHGVVLMVELGDLREGILPCDLEAVVGRTLDLPGLALQGIGTNLACQSGVAPDQQKMDELSSLATALESTFGIALAIVSGGNSANLGWALGPGDVGRVNNLRLGESILLGREPLHRHPIDGLHTDAMTLVAEVIESKVKPSKPWGAIEQTAFGSAAPSADFGDSNRVILAVGVQDVDPSDLVAPEGLTILGGSSDHLVVDAGSRSMPVGSEIRFGVGYRALLRAMTSPFVSKVLIAGGR